MTNSTINVELNSLDVGTIPVVTSSIDVKEGGTVTVQASWPSSGSNSISCQLDFSNSETQDPFNDIENGDTSFIMTRPSSTQNATHTLSVKNDAKVMTDSYELILTIDGNNYSKDPRIVIDDA